MNGKGGRGESGRHFGSGGRREMGLDSGLTYHTDHTLKDKAERVLSVA